MMQRQLFDVNTDTGTWTDSGPSFSGSIMQARWEVTTGDTGAELAIWLQQRSGDTGNGILVVNEIDVLDTDFVRAYRQAEHNASGVADTGGTGVPIVAAGEHLRVKVTPSGAAVAGRLYVWIKN